jgi:uncharacterized membrane protein YfcA
MIISVIMALSVMAGIGGGGIVVPLCMMFFNFGTKEAIPLSGFSIFACSLLRFIMNINSKHPEKDAVAIDYNLAIVMLPTVLMGSLIGVFINVMFPSLML